VTVTLCTEELSSGFSIYTVALPSYHPGENVWGGMDDQHNTAVPAVCFGRLKNKMKEKKINFSFPVYISTVQEWNHVKD
jgi:hypothetical protein